MEKVGSFHFVASIVFCNTILSIASFPLAMLVALISLSTGAVLRWAAAARQVIARALSFKGSLQLLLAFRQQLRWSGRKPVSRMGAHLLGAIGLMMLPIRPGRVEPHAIKRRPKTHALLTVPRHIARERIVQMRAARA